MKKSIFTALSVFLGLSGLLTSCGDSKKMSFEDVDLLPVQLTEDGKWSFIDENGKVVYDSEFKNEPSMAIRGVFSVEENGGISLYRIGGKNPELVEGCDSLVCAGMMMDGVIPVTKPNERITLIDKNGKTKATLNPIKGKEIVSCCYYMSYGRLFVRTDDDLYGYVDETGKTVIEPKYNSVSTFTHAGMAVVGTLKEEAGRDPKMSYEVIDKNGKTLFKIKDIYSEEQPHVYDDKVIVQQDDRVVLLDKKGEPVKLPSQVKSFEGIQGNNVIFCNDDRQYGVCDMKGEIIIRPKYDKLWFLTEDTFGAKKERDDDEVIILDKNGEKIKDVDYKKIQWLGKFGYLASEGKTSQLLDKDFKPKSQDDYYDVKLRDALSYEIKSDYYDLDALVNRAAELITETGAGNFSLNASAVKFLKDKNKTPDGYVGVYAYFDDDNTVNSLGNIIRIRGSLNTSAGYRVPGSWSECAWNDTCKFVNIRVEIDSRKEFGKAGFDAIKKILKQKGWNMFKDTTAGDGTPVALMKKGKLIAVVAIDENSGDEGYISIVPESQEKMLLDIFSNNSEAANAEEVDNGDEFMPDDSPLNQP